MADEPLSERSLAMFRSAMWKLNAMADACGRGRHDEWMDDPRYRLEVQCYDAVCDAIPEWRLARLLTRVT